MQPVGDGQHVSLDERGPIGQSGCLGNGYVGEVDPGHTARAGAHPGQRVHAGVALQVDEVTAGHVAGDVEVEPVQSGPAGEKAARIVDIVLTVHGRTLVPPAPIDVHTATVPHRDPFERTNMQLIFGAGPQAVVLAAVAIAAAIVKAPAAAAILIAAPRHRCCATKFRPLP